MISALITRLARHGWDLLSARGDEGSAGARVVQLHPATSSTEPLAGQRPAAAARQEAPLALQDDPVIAELRARDYYELGYGDGTRAPNHEAREDGCARICAHLCDGIGRAIGMRVVLLDQEGLKLLDVGANGSMLTQERLRARIKAIERDIDTLKQQAELARGGSGWLQPLLADYRAGFERALREAVDAVYQPR